MTRGTLFYYESDERVWTSTEFNGDMYHGNRENPRGSGDKVIRLMSNLNSVDDFKRVLKEINKDYGYKEGNNCWSVSDAAIAENNKSTIEWIDSERPDLSGDKSFDPRAMEKPLTFKDIRTWHFMGLLSLSDYSYIYNNSGKDLAIKTNSKPTKMVIPKGCCGVLYYGEKDCLCKDGMIIDGMGNYKEDKISSDPPSLKKIRALGEFKYGNKNLSIAIYPNEVWEVTKECPKTLMIKNGNVELRINKPQPNKIWEFIYE